MHNLSVNSSLTLSVCWGQRHRGGGHAHECIHIFGARACTYARRWGCIFDECHMLKFADVSVCLCSWGRYAGGTTACLFDFYLVVLTLRLALEVVPFAVASLVIDTDAGVICIASQILSAFWDRPSAASKVERRKLSLYQLTKRHTWRGTPRAANIPVVSALIFRR